MTTDDDAFADQLAALDEALAAGHTPPPGGETPLLRGRLARGLHALHALNDLRRVEPSRDRLQPGATPTRIGRFDVIRELGRGGFGVVVLARDPALHREVALKLPHPSVLGDDQLRERFRREALAAAALDHPHIVPVFEVDDAGPVPYLVSAYVAGPNLATWLRDHPALPARDAAELVATLADAIAYAHAQGVVHRDLKPANVLLASREHKRTDSEQPPAAHSPGSPKITDFGLAKLVSDQDGPTRSGTAMGTPSYMSPEQARGRSSAVGPASDVYALGAILYEILTGRPPFRGESDVETVRQVCDVEPVPPRRLRPGLPRDLDTVGLKCLEKDPNRRYPSAAALADDLRRVVAGRPTVARPVGVVGRTIRLVRRKPVVAGLLAALVLALVLGTAGVWRQYRRAEAERDVAQTEQGRTARLFGDADKALETMITLGQRYAHDEANVQQSREILETARDYYRCLRKEDPNNDPLRQKAAVICHRLAVLDGEVGRHDAYSAGFEEAVGLYEEHLADHPDDKVARLKLVRMYQHGLNHWITVAAFGRATALRDRCVVHTAVLYEAEPFDAEIVASHGLLHYHRGETARLDGDLRTAEDSFRAQLAMLDRLPPERNEPRHDITRIILLARLSDVAVSQGRLAEADKLAAESVRIARANTLVDPFTPGPYYYLGEALVALGHVAAAKGRSDEALAAFAEAHPLLARCVQEHPPNVVRRVHSPYFRGVNERADVLDRLGRSADALAVLREAVVPQPLPARRPSPKVPPVPPLVEGYTRLIDHLRAAGETDEARQRAADVKALLSEPLQPMPQYDRAVAGLDKSIAALGEPAR